MWATAHFDLRLTTADFLALSPKLFDALRKRLDRQHQREELLAGTIAAQIVNFSMAHPKRPLQPIDFVWTDPPEREAEAPTSSAVLLRLFDTGVRLSGVAP